MRTLFLSNDPSIWEEGSAARTRMRTYAEVLGELHILSRAPRGAEMIHDGALTLHPSGVSKLGVFFSLPRIARALIHAHHIEIVSAQDPFEYGFAAAKAVEGTEAKLHIQVHTDFLSPWFVREGVFRSPKISAPFRNRFRRVLADMVLPRADGIRAVSVRVRDSLTARYRDQIALPSVLPIAVSSVESGPLPLPPHDFSFVLLTASRLEPEKRIEDILYALARLGYQHQHAGLIIVGEGSERAKLERLAKRLGLGKRVIFTGWREGDVVGLMKSAQVYIQASAYEGYSRTLIEAALARIPIITTDVGIVGDVLRGYEEVLAAPPGDPAALAVHILGLMEDHQARALFVAAAEKAARAHLERYQDLPGMIRDDLARTIATAPHSL